MVKKTYRCDVCREDFPSLAGVIALRFDSRKKLFLHDDRPGEDAPIHICRKCFVEIHEIPAGVVGSRVAG